MASRARGLAKLFGPAGLLSRDADGVVSLRSSSLNQSLDDLSVSSLSDVDLVVNPETLEIQTVSSGPGQDMAWLWTLTRSALPYARIPITNQAQTTVPLYKRVLTLLIIILDLIQILGLWAAIQTISHIVCF